MSSSLVPYIIINLLHKLRVEFVWMMVPNGATRCGRGVRARRAAYQTGTSPSSPCTSHPNPPGVDHGTSSSISSAQLSGWPVLLSGPRGRALLRAGSCATHAARWKQREQYLIGGSFCCFCYCCLNPHPTHTYLCAGRNGARKIILVWVNQQIRWPENKDDSLIR